MEQYKKTTVIWEVSQDNSVLVMMRKLLFRAPRQASWLEDVSLTHSTLGGWGPSVASLRVDAGGPACPVAFFTHCNLSETGLGVAQNQAGQQALLALWVTLVWMMDWSEENLPFPVLLADLLCSLSFLLPGASVVPSMLRYIFEN